VNELFSDNPCLLETFLYLLYCAESRLSFGWAKSIGYVFVIALVMLLSC